MADSEPTLDQRRVAAEKKTIQETRALNWRVQAICLKCDRARVLDLERYIAKGWGHHTVEELKPSLTCKPCQDGRRKYSINPPGKDIFLRVLFVGDSEAYVRGPSPF